MKSLYKFLLLRSHERRLLLKSLLLLWACWLGLKLLPFHTLRRLLEKLTSARHIFSEGESANVAKIVWALAVATRFVPATTCLTQAVVGQLLVAQQGEPAVLRIGVTKDEAGNLKAHAWVESRGRIVIGDSRDLLLYTPLPPVQWELR